MTPATIYKGIRDLLIFAAIAFIAWRVYSDGQNSVKAQQLAQLQKQIEQQSIIAQQWREETTHANTDLAATIARINAAPVLTHHWVRTSSGCPGREVLPPAASRPLNNPADRGPVLAVPGEIAGDARLRDTAVADFKRFWESQLAAYRAEHASWPKP